LSAATSSGFLRALARRVLPSSVQRHIREAVDSRGRRAQERQLRRLRARMYAQPPRTSGVERVLDYAVRINDPHNFYTLYKDIFVHRIYHFDAQRQDPLILDCGSNIGMSVLYFKHVYPGARVIGFEPDPVVCPCLEENVRRNALAGVRCLQAGVAGREGMLAFYSDGKCGSSLAANMSDGPPRGWQKHEVPCVRLRDYLAEPVDFLKMNIEGAEWEVLADSEDLLPNVREMVVEYHHFPGLPRRLADILALLQRTGFDYLINDLDPASNSAVVPPFRLTPQTRYYLLIYAKRMD